jgi:hypothetical protein
VPCLLQVLLDAGVLVGEVHLHLGARAEDPGAEGLLGGGADLAGEQDRDLLGPADTDVVGHQGLNEPAGPARVVKHDRAADLDLAHGQLPPGPGRTVGAGEGRRDLPDPAVEEALDHGRAEAIADPLQARRLVAGGKAVGELGDDQAGLGRLPLGPLVPVEPHLGRVGEVAAELDEARAEVGIKDVEVVDGHGPVGLLEAEVDRLAMGVLAPLIAHEDLLDLLSNHDRHHPTAALPLGLLQVGADVVELAIVPAGAVGPLEAQQGMPCSGQRPRLPGGSGHRCV